MAFRFNKWDEAFRDEDLLTAIKQRLESEMNSEEGGLVSLKVTRLSLGTKPPRLHIHDIPVVSESRLSVLVRVEYDGDACLCVTAHLHITSINGGFFGATGFWSTPTTDDSIPVSVVIEGVKVAGMLAVEVREEVPGSRDISIRFVDDPLESVEVSSSLDRQVPFVKSLLNAHISSKLRQLLMVDLPEMAKHRIELPFLAPHEPQQVDLVSNLEKYSELATQPSTGFAMIARDAASMKSANSRGIILTKTSMKRW